MRLTFILNRTKIRKFYTLISISFRQKSSMMNEWFLLKYLNCQYRHSDTCLIMNICVTQIQVWQVAEELSHVPLVQCIVH